MPRPRTGGACWEWTVPADTEITGPMALRLWVAVRDADDVSLFAGVEKWRGRSYVPFEGPYGFGRDRITTGWLKGPERQAWLLIPVIGGREAPRARSG